MGIAYKLALKPISFCLINIIMNLYYEHHDETLIVNKVVAASHDFQTNNRSSRSKMFPGKHPCWNLFLIKL